MTISRLRSLVEEDFAAVNSLIIDNIQSDVGLIDDLSHHIVESGGKRLRPLLVLLASKCCGYQGRSHITLAAMIEFFHTVTLLHDDVVDKSTLRRGRETANQIWGSQASILVGDYLFTLYIKLMLEVGDWDIMAMLNDIAHQISCGEIKQLNNRQNTELCLEEYFDIIRSKTSLLFAASASLGAMVSGTPKEQRQALFDYGLHLGNAFQLIDDALDYCSDAKTLGKNIGDDLADGKATLPLIHVLKQGSTAQQELVRTALTQGSIAYLPQILEAIEANKAIEYTKKIAAAEADKAQSALHCLPDSVYKEALIELACYAIERDH